ncbi:hypothetical protein HNP48_005908 [Acidovorax soli]|uniref:Lipoprotein n=1 Tax=Acidovorax soli TaxID=592050 RepID=A0A7X0UCN9_9BURK|nr:hypothetical protein [Acidovorax soli]MBB6563189.1 hypothetical protein [Acidovorax soli]
MARLQSCLTIALLAGATQAIACPPPATFTPWPEQVAQAYAQSQAVYIAQAVRTQAGPQQDGYGTVRVFLKPLQFFKGGPAHALPYIDKAGHTCDQRPVPTERGKVLVFASAQGELLRAIPEQDKDNPPKQPPPYASALRQVQRLSQAGKN